MKFLYQGYDRAAKKVQGEIEAANEAEVRVRLRSLNVRPIKIVSRGGGGGGGGGSAAGFDIQALFAPSPTPDLFEFTAFIRQLATMQGAGIPIVQSLAVLSEQVENRGFGKVLAQVQKHIEEGTNLTDALKKYPKVFDRIFINLISAGEVSGSLDKILLRLAQYYEKSAQLRRKVKGAMTYPVLIIVMVIVVVGVLLYAVVPVFAGMFAGAGKELPGPTQVILDLSNFLRNNILYILMFLGGCVYGIKFVLSDERSRRSLDKYFMRMPLFGDLFMKIGIARFSRTLGTMIQSGVPILDALDITSRVAGNYAIESAIARTRQSISEGNSIAGPLMQAKVFPKMAVSMIAIGEQTGALDQMLSKIAEFYEDEVDAKVSSLTSILEPLLIAVVGLIVAGVLIPMYLPIFKMGDALGG